MSLSLVLVACGSGGDDAPAPAAPSGPVNVQLAGAVVKGPVDGASVCAFAIEAGARGASLGPCATTTANGAYALSVTTAAADILIEATGGHYTDETTSLDTTVPAGSVLSSLVPAAAGPVNAYITPLTTLAVNAARAQGALNSTTFTQRASALLASFGLDAALDIVRTAPVVSGSANAYGQALQAISRMIANGVTLANLLAATDPATFASAFQTALAAGTPPTTPTPPTEPTTPTPPTTPAGTVSASGSVTIAGGNGNGFTPDATAFTVVIDDTRTKYRFEKQVATTINGYAATTTEYIEVTRVQNSVGGPFTSTSVAVNASGSFKVANCPTNCGVTFETPQGATHPITVKFDATQIGSFTLNGTLVGDASGAAWSVADFARTTDGIVNLGATSRTVVTGNVSTSVDTGTGHTRIVTLNLEGGAIMTFNQVLTPANVVTGSTVGYLPPGGSPSFCIQNCAFTVTENASGTVLALNGTALEGGIVLTNTIFLGRTQGTMTTSTLGSFTPISDSIKSSNDTRTLAFSVLGTQAQNGISLVVVTVRGTKVTQVSVTTGIGAGVYQCFEQDASIIGVPACQGGTVSANGRVVTLTNVTVGGGTVGQRTTSVLNGTLTSRGL